MGVETGKRSFWRGSIKRLLLLPLLIVMLSLLLVQVGIYVRQYRHAIADEYRANLEMARAVAATFDSYVEEIRRDELALGESFLLPPESTPSQASALLQHTVSRYRAIESFSWISSEGRVVASSWPASTSIDVSRERWFSEIRRGRDWSMTDVARARDPSERTFEIAQGLRDRSGKLLGVVAATVYSERLGERIAVERTWSGAYSIVDSSGWLAYRYPEEVAWEHRDWVREYAEVHRALQGEEVTDAVRDAFDGRRRLSAFVPIASVGWVARASRLESEAIGPMRRSLERDAGLLAAVALLALALALLAARRIAQPLARLGEHAREVGRGRLGHRVQVSGPAELAGVAEALNRMAEEVQAREGEHQQLLEAERERARNARLLEAVQEHTLTMLAYLDRDLRFRHANPQYCQFLGRLCEDLIGRTYPEVSESKVVLETIQRVRDTGEAVHRRDLFRPPTELPKVGPTYWDVSVVPLKDETGAVEGVVVSMIDVTDRVRAREERVEMERARAQLAETMGAEINHRMKNNLVLLSGVLQLQLSGLPPDSGASHELREAIARISSLSVVHEELYEGNSGKVELNATLRRIGEIASGSLSRGDVDISVIGQSIYVPSKIGSIVAMVANELLTNAIKYGAPTNGGRVRIEVGLRREEGRVRLGVWNSGNPVPESFDVNRQNGLGLRLASGLVVEQLGGTMALRPQEGGTMAEVEIGEGVIGNRASDSAMGE